MRFATKIIIVAVGVGAVLLVTGSASAQDAPYECDDRLGMCGTPDQSGGGCGCGGSILVANTDDGDTYQSADDYDDDGREDPYDNCWSVPNRDQADNDGDGLGNVCDNCPSAGNKTQDDLDGDLTGDACDTDDDGDGIADDADNCPKNPNPGQGDVNGNSQGDACDPDADGDGIANLEDECPLAIDASSGACDLDGDGDEVSDLRDKCPLVADDQQDMDSDNLGDACDADQDGDGINNNLDNCPTAVTSTQDDLDGDGVGDACDEQFCYVVDGDAAHCLDPAAPFAVYSPSREVVTGDAMTLYLFANRVNQAIRYTWDVVESPSGSAATIENPTGAVNHTVPKTLQYSYLKERTVTFNPDKPGTYVLRVVAELVWEDEVTGRAGETAEAFATIEVGGDDLTGSGCSVANVGPRQGGVSLLLLALAGLLAGAALLRRR